MRERIQAEDGDDVSVVTTSVSLQQAIVQVEIENQIFDCVDIFSLTPTRARELAQALTTAADVVERHSVSDNSPPFSLQCLSNVSPDILKLI